MPLVGGSVQPIVLEGQAELLPRDQPTVQVRHITPGYLKTMRIPVLRGRDVVECATGCALVCLAVAIYLVLRAELLPSQEALRRDLP